MQVLNDCKYYNGDYANSQRERMMYEADCYIQQMSHYSVDREFAIGRYSLENRSIMLHGPPNGFRTAFLWPGQITGTQETTK